MCTLSPPAADLGDHFPDSDHLPRVQLVVRGVVAKLTMSALSKSQHFATLEATRQPLDSLTSHLHRDVPVPLESPYLC